VAAWFVVTLSLIRSSQLSLKEVTHLPETNSHGKPTTTKNLSSIPCVVLFLELFSSLKENPLLRVSYNFSLSTIIVGARAEDL
jgi:hypothetical protein